MAPDPTRGQRRLGIKLALGSFVLFVSLCPLACVFFLVSLRWAAGIWLTVGVLQVVTGVSAAHALFGARDGDRTRAQGLCMLLGSTAGAVATLGMALTFAFAVILLAILTEPVPWACFG
ncbi:MAG TPA: hypothetical protein VM925_08325 [Labilithrix sp.]|nr:hypothetical protein [Labilithrix sp.]